LKKLIEFIEEHEKFTSKINGLIKELENIPDGTSDFLIETIRERIVELTKERDAFEQQTIYTETYFNELEPWKE
jgi:hypothetical protein